MKARGRATGVASGARTGDPHGNHLHPKWSSVPPDHLGHSGEASRPAPLTTEEQRLYNKLRARVLQIEAFERQQQQERE